MYLYPHKNWICLTCDNKKLTEKKAEEHMKLGHSCKHIEQIKQEMES